MRTTTGEDCLRNTPTSSWGILVRLDAADSPTGMDVPGFSLHPLKGEFQGFWAVTVRANWRLIFRFVDPDALDVDYVDYH
jgi:proteic killer suppression protein